MAKVVLAKEMRERFPGDAAAQERRPFLTISREYGCWGFSLGLLLMDTLNETVPAGRHWRILSKEILDRLAHDTATEVELLEAQRRTKPSMLLDFLGSLSDKRVPSGYEVRNRITSIIRHEANKGFVVIVGQGGAGATADMPNGLAIRLEAPEEWRIAQLAFRENIDSDKAREEIQRKEAERAYLRRIYEVRFPRRPAFHLMFDCSVFTLAQITQMVVQAMRLKKLID